MGRRCTKGKQDMRGMESGGKQGRGRQHTVTDRGPCHEAIGRAGPDRHIQNKAPAVA